MFDIKSPIKTHSSKGLSKSGIGVRSRVKCRLQVCTKHVSGGGGGG